VQLECHKQRTLQITYHITSSTIEIKSCLSKNYAVGDKVLLILNADERRIHPKMEAPTRGPFAITAVHSNGTVNIHRGQTTETINIRRVKPYISK
jgi:hypothetical protein